MSDKREKIALLHHTGGGNLGDDATVDVVIENIRRRIPHAELVIFSMNPSDTSARHGVPSEPIRRHTWDIGYAEKAKSQEHASSTPNGSTKHSNNRVVRLCRKMFGEIAFQAASFRKLRQYDQLVISGGGQLTERSGPWGFPYAIFIWVLMARLAGLRCIFLSVGAGPLKHPISRFLVARSLGAAHYVSFRDVESQLLAQEVGFHGISTVYPDSAYALQWDASAASAPVRDRPVVGLAPMPFPFCDPREYASGHQEVYEEYLRKFAAFAAYLAREHRLEMFGSDAGADASAIEDLRQILKNNHGIDVPPCGPAHTVDELLSRMSAMDYVVTCRFHGVVLAHILNKPIIGIAHHPKVSHLMQALGMGKYCADIRTFDPSHLCMAFAELASNDSKIRQRMAISLEQYRSDVARQFDRLFSPAGVAAEDIPSAVETSAALAK